MCVCNWAWYLHCRSAQTVCLAGFHVPSFWVSPTGWLKTVDQYFMGANNSIQHAGVQVCAAPPSVGVSVYVVRVRVCVCFCLRARVSLFVAVRLRTRACDCVCECV